MKNRGLMVGSLAFLVSALAYCSFGPDEYAGPWPPEAPEEDGGGTDDGGGTTDDGGGMMDDGGTGGG